MDPDEFLDAYRSFTESHNCYRELIDALPIAQDDHLSEDHTSDSLAEGVFLRMFSEYESVIENLTIHYIMNGKTLAGREGRSLVLSLEIGIVKRMIRGSGAKLPSFSNPGKAIETSKIFLDDGWPISQALQTKTQQISDAEKIRNRIAHKSDESRSHFQSVQRNILQTERTFPITPGQFMRIRVPRNRKTIISSLQTLTFDVVSAIFDPEF